MLTEAYVAGLTQENASKLLDRAHELGLPASVVRTVDGGFIVPAVLVEDAPAPAPEPVQEETDGELVPRATTPAIDAPSAAPKRATTTRKAATKNQSADDSTADAVASEE